MLSAKEIADYVHGRVEPDEKQQFSFSGSTKPGDALIIRWHTSTGFTDGEPILTGETAPTAKANETSKVLSRLTIRVFEKMSAMKRNTLLILLFLAVFAAAFVLESRHAPANPTRTFSGPNSTVGH